jgi:hypothetical protein
MLLSSLLYDYLRKNQYQKKRNDIRLVVALVFVLYFVLLERLVLYRIIFVPPDHLLLDSAPNLEPLIFGRKSTSSKIAVIKVSGF